MHSITGNKTNTYSDAREPERKGELKAAASIYRLLHKRAPQKLKLLDRLIIVYRKLKDVVNEVKCIDAAKKIHEQYYAGQQNADKQTIAISKQLNFLLGHTDKKGKPVYKPDELIKLEMRKKRLLAGRTGITVPAQGRNK